MTASLLLLLLLLLLFDPRVTKIRSITKYYKISWNYLPPHQQSSRRAELHWSVESTLSAAISFIIIMS